MSLSKNDSLKPGQRRVPPLDSDAFAVLVEEHQVAVYNLCCRMLGDPHLAEDAAQETFLRAFQARHRFDPARSVRTWLLSIAAHHCIDALRRRARLTWLPLGYRPLSEPGPGPEAALLRNEKEEEVSRLLDRLKPDERAAIVLRYWYDLSVEAIADATGASADAVRTRLYRARRRLAGSDPASADIEAGVGGNEPRSI
jgi:RNA polymerase sigma-70 factor (ECF subfamily)